MRYTLILIFNEDYDNILLMYKIKGPFPNTWNGVGGKIENSDNNPMEGALREVKEEIGLDANHFNVFKELLILKFPDDVELNVFYGTVKNNTRAIQMEDEEIAWFNVEDLFDVRDNELAGYGNLPYFINMILNLEVIK